MPTELAVRKVPGVSHTLKRAVVFLDGDSNLDAGTEFDKVANGKTGKKLKRFMEYWISFMPDKAGKYHRFKNEKIDAKYRECFVFKELESKVRLYGFICHPTPMRDRSFEVVVLTTSAIKKEDLTDTANLDRVLIWKNSEATKAALQKEFPDGPKVESKSAGSK